MKTTTDAQKKDELEALKLRAIEKQQLETAFRTAQAPSDALPKVVNS